MTDKIITGSTITAIVMVSIGALSGISELILWALIPFAVAGITIIIDTYKL